MANHKTEKEKSQITSRELQVLRLIADGHTSAMIAEILCITVNTVHNHRVRIFEKLDAHNVASMLKAARQKGVIS